ncbi:threonine--tRNA ligase [Micavibrio aeruginosavorus]|uniref:Threonine--tRNA ligase n=1 Tax=Micavibrio aeruginosavorus (strain ARL-13) TaxID=856793 RepID=G2KMS6_MICAA|nr:threonine--tRNA ligase [Micavibrio aeruginosavorus]AEP08463.1 threonyl-tRNA synthetase [Micavibrio aeruginosavorus ARL-13]
MSNTAAALDHITLTLPDGATRTVPAGTTGLQFAESIAKSLAKAAIAISVNGDIRDLSRPLEDGATVSIIKREDNAALEMIRHDCAHVLAEAVQELFPGTQVTIGPSIENGFYYDFARNEPFTLEDLPKIEAKMKEIIGRGAAFEREVWDRNDAIKFFTDKGEMYKAELIRDLPGTETITIYKQGTWLDLCRGPHMPTTKHIGTAFKLTKVAGAYWRGDSSKAMLTRIYGTAWRTEDELQAYLTQIEEAEKRDHRKLGREMDLFHLQEEAQGSVFWHDKGYTIWLALEGYVRRRLKSAGYIEVKTPQLMDSRFWEQSGHWGKYRENMFVVPDVVPNTDEGGKVFKEEPKHFMALKPMNCPAHVQIFNQGIKSYRDLPIRMAEFGCCHRNEAHGALHGLMRVRQFTQDDAHIFCREDQIEAESMAFCELLRVMYTDLGFTDVVVKLATRPEKRVGTEESWDYAENALKQALDKAGLAYEIAPGDGAFYGPKLEFHIRDAIGRSWTCGTLQLDPNLPERLGASYVGEDGAKHRPLMLHRAILGSLERFIGILIENYAGKLPLWLAPVQCVVATITSDADDYARDVLEKLKVAGIRAEIDLRNEKINYKVREHSLAKVPVMFVVGKREAEEQKVAIRRLGDEKQAFDPLESAIQALAESVKPPY